VSRPPSLPAPSGAGLLGAVCCSLSAGCSSDCPEIAKCRNELYKFGHPPMPPPIPAHTGVHAQVQQHGSNRRSNTC
jgi:hypothetical protein